MARARLRPARCSRLQFTYPETTTATGFELKLPPEGSATPAHTQRVALADVQFAPNSAAAFTVTLPGTLPPGRYTAELAATYSGGTGRAATSSAFAIGKAGLCGLWLAPHRTSLSRRLGRSCLQRRRASSGQHLLSP